MIICKSNKEAKLLSQLLNIPSLERVHKHRNANGEMIINTLIKMYLNAKLMISANDEKESIPRKYSV